VYRPVIVVAYVSDILTLKQSSENDVLQNWNYFVETAWNTFLGYIKKERESGNKLRYFTKKKKPQN
jgi:hypothetical protein